MVNFVGQLKQSVAYTGFSLTQNPSTELKHTEDKHIHTIVIRLLNSNKTTYQIILKLTHTASSAM